MDTLYSLTLFISLATGVMALLFAITFYIKRHQQQPSRLASRKRALMVIIGGAVVMLMVSLGVHIIAGHPPGSPQGLGVGEFFTIHPAYLAALALPLAAFILVWVYRGKQKDGQDGAV